MPYTFLDLAIEVIKKEKVPMSVNSIWCKAKELGLDAKLPKYGKTPEQTLGARIYMSIKQDVANSPFIQVSKRPALFFLRELSIPTVAPTVIVSENEKHSYKEEIYTKYYLHSFFQTLISSAIQKPYITKCQLIEKKDKMNGCTLI